VTGVLVGLAGELLRPTPEPTSATLTPDPALLANGIQRWAINLDETAVLGATGLVAEVAVSPDGRQIAYATGGTPNSRLYIRALDRFEPTLMPVPEGARRPFFSGDGEWVAFGVLGDISKVSVRGGPPQTLATTGRIFGGSWGDDDMIVVSLAGPVAGMAGMGMSAGPLMRFPVTGGAPEVLISPEPGSLYTWPEVLPGANAVLFTIRAENTPASEGSIAVLDLDTNEHRTLILGGYNARYAPTGHIVFARGGALWAVPFDLQQLEITGTEAPMVEGVQMNSATGDVPYGFSDNGLLVYVRGSDTVASPADPTRRFVWLDRNGREALLPAEVRTYFNLRISPDHQRVAVTIAAVIGGAVNQDIYILDLARSTLSRLTSDPANDQRAVWTPDGQRVVYWSAREESGLFWRAANGTGQADRLTMSLDNQHPEFFSPDGTQLVFRDSSQGNWDLWVRSMGAEPAAHPLLQTEFNEAFSTLSPNGRWMAYQSDETGRFEVYVRPFPNIDDDKIPISSNGGEEPLWGPDGGELFYVHQADDGDAEILRVAVTEEPTFVAGEPEVLFTASSVWEGGSPRWDISSDGQRFLMIKNTDEADPAFAQASIAVVDNWFEDLRRLTPTE